MAGSITTTIKECHKGHQKISIAWTSDASGDVNGTNIPLTGIIFRVVTDPGGGGSAPTDNYDISLTDPDDAAVDVMQSQLANRDTANAEAIDFCGVGALTNGSPIYVNGEYGFKVANAGNAKSGTVHIYLAK